MARALRAWAINRGGKTSVRNLRYGPRTRLVRGMYFSFLGALRTCTFFGTPAVELLVYSEFDNKKRKSSGRPVCLLQVIWRVVTRSSVSYLLEHKLVIALLPRMIITGSHLYIWMERGTVKENCLSQDDMTMP